MSRRLRFGEDGRELTAFGTPAFPFSIFENDSDQFVDGCIPWHWHDGFEFDYVLEGSVTMESAKGSRTIKAGEGLFFNYGVLHNAKRAVPGYSAWITIQFDTEVIAGAPHSVFESKYIKPFIEAGNADALVFRAKSEEEKTILSLLRAAYEIDKKKEYGYEIELRNRFSEIWLLIVRQYGHTLGDADDKPDDGRIKEMLRFIHDHYMDEISLEDIAKSAGVSGRECSRCFQKRLGTTAFAYLMAYRVRVAAELLRETGLSVTEICFRTGFGGTSYFGKSFKSITGMTPREFRKISGDA